MKTQPKQGDLLSRVMKRQAARPPQTLPFVSVVTPTCNRRAFLPYLLYMFQYQDYPADRRELVILDDSPESNADLIASLTRYAAELGQIRYYHLDHKLTLGQKRNQLNELAQGEYIVCMDDDDFYPADKLSYTLSEMQQHHALFAGCDAIPIWYSHINRIYFSKSLGAHHALNGTFAYHRSFLKKHRYDDASTLAEEEAFLNGFTVPVLQLDPWKSILCVSHSSNTFDKDFVMGSCEVQASSLHDVVGDPFLRQHFQRLHNAPSNTQIDWSLFEHICVLASSGSHTHTAEFCQQLTALGVKTSQLQVIHTQNSEDISAVHQDLLSLARQHNWQNYLLLDDRLHWVRQRKAVNNMNQLTSALRQVNWHGVLLAGELREGFPIKALPAAIKPVDIGYTQLAYAINREGYEHVAALLAEVKEQQSWHPFETGVAAGRWFALYPSLMWLDKDDKGSDCAAYFFRKLS